MWVLSGQLNNTITDMLGVEDVSIVYVSTH